MIGKLSLLCSAFQFVRIFYLRLALKTPNMSRDDQLARVACFEGISNGRVAESNKRHKTKEAPDVSPSSWRPWTPSFCQLFHINPRRLACFNFIALITLSCLISHKKLCYGSPCLPWWSWYSADTSELGWMDVLTDSTYVIIIRLLQKHDTLIVWSCQCHTPSCSYGPRTRSCGGGNPFGCRDNQVYCYTQVLIFF